MISGGVHGLFVLGSSGELYGLTKKQKEQVIAKTVEYTSGRVPIYCGAGEITTKGSIETVKIVEKIGGVSALSVLTPYFINPSQNELIDHYTKIADSTDLPIILYGSDNRTNVKIDVQTCEKLSHHTNIIGIKDSSGDMARMADYISSTKDNENFSVLSGRDTLIYSGLCHGVDGAIAATANIAPKLVSDIYDEFMKGNYKKSLELQFKLSPLRFCVEKSTFPVVLKEGLKLLGINAGYAS